MGMLKKCAGSLKKSICRFCDGAPAFYVFIAAFIPFVLFGELFGAITHRGLQLVNMLMLFASVLLCGYLIGVRKKPGGLPAVLLLMYSVWLTGTRIVLGDTGLTDNLMRIGYIVFSALPCFCIPKLLGTVRMREKLLRTVMLVLICFCMLICVGTLMVPLLGFGSDTRLGEVILFRPEDGRLKFSHIYSTILGVYCFFGVFSALLGAAWTKKIATRAIFLVLAFFMLTMQSVVDARAANMVTGAGIGAAAGLLLYEFLKKKSATGKKIYAKPVRSAVCIILGCVLLLSTMKYMSVASGFIRDASNKFRENRAAAVEQVGGGADQQPDWNAPVEEPAAPDQSEAYTLPDSSGNNAAYNNVQFSNRELSLVDILTLTKRTYVYEYGIKNVLAHPKILLMGELYSGEPIVVECDDGYIREYSHYHNSMLMTLYETGLPGLILMFLFCVLTAIRAFKVFFNISGKYKPHDRLIAVYIAALMIIGMIEPILFSTPDSAQIWTIAILFVFFSGYIHAIPDTAKAE